MELPFESLKVSTSTQLVYFNGIVDWQKLFDYVQPTAIEVPVIKKQKFFPDGILRRTLSAINRKALKAPSGSIISIGTGSDIKGIDLEKKKKIKCNICHSEGESKSKKLARKVVVPTTKFGCKGYEIKFECVRCNRIYDPIEFGKDANFRNQTSVHITPNGTHFLHMMVFKNCIKVAGAKAPRHTLECVKKLWYNYIIPSGSFVFNPKIPKPVKSHSEPIVKKTSIREINTILPLYRSKTIGSIPTSENLLILKCRTSMMNFDFEIGFTVDKDKLDSLVGTGKFSDMIMLCTRDNTSSSNTNVNIKMMPNLTDCKYPSLIIDINNSSGKAFTHCDLVDDNLSRKTPKTEPSVTFIVFSSGKTILTGINYTHMKICYQYFLNMMKENRSLIEEKINNVVVDIDKLLS